MSRVFTAAMIISTIINIGLIYQFRGDISRLNGFEERLEKLNWRCAQFQLDATECDEFVLKTQRLIIVDLKRLDANQKHLIDMAMKNEEVTQ